MRYSNTRVHVLSRYGTLPGLVLSTRRPRVHTWTRTGTRVTGVDIAILECTRVRALVMQYRHGSVSLFVLFVLTRCWYRFEQILKSQK